ncbi:MAG: glutaredoxin family protein, partial [Wenzhouxiangellaceae bacterium]
MHESILSRITTRTAESSIPIRIPTALMIIIVLAVLTAGTSAGAPLGASDSDHATASAAVALHMHVFKRATCPHCQSQRPWLDALAANDPALEVTYYEIETTREHHPLLLDMAEAHGARAGSVPMAFLGGRVWVGDTPVIRNEIEQWLEHCKQNE